MTADVYMAACTTSKKVKTLKLVASAKRGRVKFAGFSLCTRGTQQRF